MYKKLVPALLFLAPFIAQSQSGKMTPELLWKLGRITPLGISTDGKYLVYSVSTPDAEANKSSRKSYIIPVTGGTPTVINKPDSILKNKNISPDGRFELSNKEVKL